MIPAAYREAIEKQLTEAMRLQNEVMLKAYDDMYDRLPSSLGETEKIKTLKDMITNVTASIQSSIGLVKKEFKEQLNGK